MRAVIFDLDDTLYSEIEFVRSGFREAAHYLAAEFAGNEGALFGRMCEILEAEGRGRVFDTLLNEMGLYSEARVRLLVMLYRSHRPAISLYPSAVRLIAGLREMGALLGLVTDGMASVQRNKIRALGVERVFEAIVCTDELGRDCWKPSVIPFRIALELLDVAPGEAVYVGDDPSKDFTGPNSLGMMTIQVGDKRVEGDFMSDTPPEYKTGTLEGILSIIRVTP